MKSTPVNRELYENNKPRQAVAEEQSDYDKYLKPAVGPPPPHQKKEKKILLDITHEKSIHKQFLAQILKEAFKTS